MKKTRVARYLFRLESGFYQTEMHEGDGIKRRRLHRNRKIADAFIAEMLHQRFENKKHGGAKRPLRYLMTDAIADFEATKRDLRSASIKRYKPIFEQLRIFVRLHEITFIDEFTPDHGTALFNALTAPRRDPKGSTDRILRAAPKTVNLFLQTIKGLFEDELRKGHINRNPLAHVRNLPLERSKPEYYSKEELKAFFRVPMDEAYRRAFLGLLLTGMRFEELACLPFNHVDMDKRLLHIRSYDDFVTKTENGERSIPMSDDLFHLMETIIDQPLSPRYVFASPKGHKLRERSLLSVCKRTGERAGLECRMFLHKFRHTHASHLVQRGVSLEHLRALLGHSTINETEVYAHLKPDKLHDQVSKLDGLLDE